jgi:hypothetical protein
VFACAGGCLLFLVLRDLYDGRWTRRKTAPEIAGGREWQPEQDTGSGLR